MSAGSMSPPSATMVTPDAPVRAVKKAQVISDTMARPPGARPIRAVESLTRRLLA